MTEDEKISRIRAKLKSTMDVLSKWPEDKVKTLLKEQLEKEGWTITQVSMGKKRGKDLEATKDNKVIHIEAKGEPNSPLSYRQERYNFIGPVLMSLIAHMNQEDDNRAFCMAFPDNEYYLRGVQKQIPLYVRNKLKIVAMFLRDDNTIQVLFSHANNATTLSSFDELFKTGQEA